MSRLWNNNKQKTWYRYTSEKGAGNKKATTRMDIPLNTYREIKANRTDAVV